MSIQIYIEIIIIIILIILNGLFALSELAVVSSNRIRVEKLAEEGNKRAKVLLKLINEPNEFLSTVQIGITLIGIISGAFGGAALSEYLIPSFARFMPVLYAETISVAIVVIIITYFTLLIGELVPKKIALNNPEKVGLTVARPMNTLSKIVRPASRFLSGSITVVLKIIGIKDDKKDIDAEEEINLLVEEGRRTGEFEKVEEEILKRVLLLDDNKITSIMTPRKDMIWLDTENSDFENIKIINKTGKSVFPVACKSLDDFKGVVQLKDLYSSYIETGKLDLKKNIKEPILAPESLDILEILELYREAANKPATLIVIDEYGGIEGLSTVTDLLEALVGEMPGIGEFEEPEIVERTDGSWLVDPSIDIGEFKEKFDIDYLPEEEEGGYHTLGGFIMDYIAKVPKVGTKFTWENFSFEIIDMDGYHIDKILIYKNDDLLESETEAEELLD